MFFPMVIHSNKSVFSKHQFISIDHPSWMEVNFVNQNPCMPPWPGVSNLVFFEYYYFYYFNHCDFFTPTLAGGLSLESNRFSNLYTGVLTLDITMLVTKGRGHLCRSPGLFYVFWPISTDCNVSP